jgi:carbon storage regulator
MLVLTRRVDESITIGDNIVVTVLGIESDRVKLGIAAPRDILILRQEMYQAVQAQTRLQELLVEVPEAEGFSELRKLLEDADQTSAPNPAEPDPPDSKTD